MTMVEKFEVEMDEEEGFDPSWRMVPGNDWVRAEDYDALAASLVAYRELVDPALAEIPSLQARIREWRPIETPPPVGTRVLVYLSEDSFSSGIARIWAVTWKGPARTHWIITHWMPLPEPPA